MADYSVDGIRNIAKKSMYKKKLVIIVVEYPQLQYVGQYSYAQ